MFKIAEGPQNLFKEAVVSSHAASVPLNPPSSEDMRRIFQTYDNIWQPALDLTAAATITTATTAAATKSISDNRDLNSLRKANDDVPQTVLGSNEADYQAMADTRNAFEISEHLKPTECRQEVRVEPVVSTTMNSKRPIKRRVLGGRIRQVFTDKQTERLEEAFATRCYITPEDNTFLADLLNLTYKQVKHWFQNRRCKERKINKKFEFNFSKPKSTTRTNSGPGLRAVLLPPEASSMATPELTADDIAAHLPSTESTPEKEPSHPIANSKHCSEGYHSEIHPITDRAEPATQYQPQALDSQYYNQHYNGNLMPMNYFHPQFNSNYQDYYNSLNYLYLNQQHHYNGDLHPYSQPQAQMEMPLYPLQQQYYPNSHPLPSFRHPHITAFDQLNAAGDYINEWKNSYQQQGQPTPISTPSASFESSENSGRYTPISSGSDSDA